MINLDNLLPHIPFDYRSELTFAKEVERIIENTDSRACYILYIIQISSKLQEAQSTDAITPLSQRVCYLSS
jgi:hypothetical protein